MALNNIINTIKNAVYGKDVRGAIADGLNEVSQRQDTAINIANLAKTTSDNANSRVNNLIAHSGTSNTETVDMRHDNINNITYNTAGQRLDSINESLAESISQISSLENSNGKNELNLMNYLGNYQNIHPKVLYFPNGWNGYKYWMAYTPYPNGSTNAENPCIAVSNDMINWTTPSGLINPLDPTPSNGYNSDTHLVFRGDTNTLELWFRTVINSDTITIYRMTSLNGVTWTNKQVIMTSTASNGILLSPAVNFENNIYKMWICDNQKLKLYTSTDSTGLTWNNPVDLDIDWGNLTPWHQDIISTELGYEMIVCAYTPGNNNNSADLYYVLQKLDGTFTKPRLIIKRSKNITAFDYTSIYRSSILKVDGVYYLFYSSISNDNARHMSLSMGIDIGGLNGFQTLQVRKPGSGIVRISGGTTLTDYDVSNIDTIIAIGNSPVVINSFSGAYMGKQINVIIEGTNASAILNYSTSRLLLPGLKNYTLDKENMGMTLICTNDLTTMPACQFRGYGDAKQGSRIIRIAGGTTLTDYDISNLDTIICTGSNPVVINSFSGGYVGKKLNLLVEGTNASAILNYDVNRLSLPGLKNYVLDTKNMGMELICTNDVFTSGATQFRGYAAQIYPNIATISGGTTLTNYDLSNVDVLKITGTTPVIINSFSGGYLGKKITVVLEGSLASAQFNYGTSLITPGLANYTLTTAKLGVDVICTDTTNNIWRVMA